MKPGESSGSAPRVSVLVFVSEGGAALSLLHDRLARQSPTVGDLEVCHVPEASGVRLPAHLPSGMRSEPELVEDLGPVPAWNRALQSLTGEVVLFLHEQSLPASGLLNEHLAVHEKAPRPLTVLGTSLPVSEERWLAPRQSAESGVHDTPIPFPYAAMRSDALHGWECFTTWNLSVRRVLLERVGGFDADCFTDGVGAAEDLGYRLAALGCPVLFHEAAACEEEIDFDQECWLSRRSTEGQALARLHRKHGDDSILWFAQNRDLDDALLRRLQRSCEQELPRISQILAILGRHELGGMSEEALDRLRPHLFSAGAIATWRGVLLEAAGADPGPVILEGPTEGKLTSIIVCSFDQLDMTKDCLAALRKWQDERHPTEILFVDNGSTDGSREFLEEQDDVELIANESNLGAPIARNQALRLSKGESVVFMDNDAMVGPGWLRRLLYHAEVDRRAAFIGPVSDRVAHGQSVDGVPSDRARVPDFTRERATEHDRAYRLNAMLSSFCILVRREVLDLLGGFDPRFSPWGFEDDDITLRAHLAGWHNRIADDVFVQHLPYRGAAKAKTHQELLERNWSRFAVKWGLPADTPYGRHEDVHRMASSRSWSDAELHVPLDAGLGRSAEGVPLPTTPEGVTEELELQGEDSTLEFSVVAPLGGDAHRLRTFLQRLDEQTVGPDAFELILISSADTDCSPVEATEHRFDIRMIPRDQRGSVAALNAAIAECRAPITVFFDEWAVPARDNLEQHLAARSEKPGRHAVLGATDVTEERKGEFFNQVLEGTSLLQDHLTLEHGRTHPWQFFWTNNLSVPTRTLRKAGGFDADAFADRTVAGLELGYRLQKTGWSVLHWGRARCGKDISHRAADFHESLVMQGRQLYRMFLKHGDPRIVWLPVDQALDETALSDIQLVTERALRSVKSDLAELVSRESQCTGLRLSERELTPLRARVGRAVVPLMQAGLVQEASGSAVWATIRDGVPSGEVTVILAATEPLALEASLDSLHACTPQEHSQRILVVHEAGREDIEQILEAFPDVETLGLRCPTREMEAWNIALTQSDSEWSVLLEEGACLFDGWLDRMVFHGAVDARVGCVGPLTDWALPSQVVDGAPGQPIRGEDFAAQLAEQDHAASLTSLLSPHCLLVRRQTLTEIGGLDPSLDDTPLAAADFTLRAELAGWRIRVARDCFCQRPLGSGTEGPQLPPSAAWRRLALKFGAGGTVPGDYESLVSAAKKREWRLQDLHVPLDLELASATGSTPKTPA